jgi:probable phosphoglycerate mutase
MNNAFRCFFSLLCFFGIFAASLLPAGEVTHLYLIRNGATPRNVLGFVQGQEEVADAQLNQEGREQADRAGKLLQTMHPELAKKFYSSPLGRALDTAKLAAKYFNNVRIIKKDDLKEISHGGHDGMEKGLRNKFYNQFYEREIAKFHAQFPEYVINPYFKWSVNPLAGAETCLNMCQRSIKALMEIGEENLGESVAVFTHGAVIEALITHLDYQQGTSSHELLPLWYEEPCMPNCAIAHFIYNPMAEQEQELLKFVSFEK